MTVYFPPVSGTMFLYATTSISYLERIFHSIKDKLVLVAQTHDLKITEILSE
jgi:hypothetical protein